MRLRHDLSKALANLLTRYARLPAPATPAHDWLKDYHEASRPKPRQPKAAPRSATIPPAPVSSVGLDDRPPAERGPELLNFSGQPRRIHASAHHGP